MWNWKFSIKNCLSLSLAIVYILKLTVDRPSMYFRRNFGGVCHRGNWQKRCVLLPGLKFILYILNHSDTAVCCIYYYSYEVLSFFCLPIFWPDPQRSKEESTSGDFWCEIILQVGCPCYEYYPTTTVKQWSAIIVMMPFNVLLLWEIYWHQGTWPNYTAR